MSTSVSVVTLSEAARLVGIARATLYRHIPKKKISVEKDDDGNPTIQISELIRVYKDKVRLDRLESKEQGKRDTDQSIQVVQDKTPSIIHNETVENAVLKERIKLLEESQERERKQFENEVSHLRESLSKSLDNQKLLTDQRERGQSGNEEISTLKDEIQKLTKRNNDIISELRKQRDKSQELEQQIEKRKGFIDRFLDAFQKTE